ncbi:MAG: methionyl-tRNA formyltransferase [Fimbriimonadales bacterium]
MFFGSGAFAVPALERLCSEGYPILAVVTQPPKPAGRGWRTIKTPVHESAERTGLPILTPQRARDTEFLEQVRKLSPDLIVLASYGKILPQALLNIAPIGNWNLHGSLLPKYRGASPIQSAILEGEHETGVTLMEMVAEMDAGDIYLQRTIPIEPEDDAGSLEDKLAHLGADLLVEGLQRLQEGTLQRTPQNHAEATYTKLLTKEDMRLRWDESAHRCHNRVRAFLPKYGGWTTWRGKLLKIWRTLPIDASHTAEPGTIVACSKEGVDVACGEGALRLLEVQPESRAKMTIPAFLNGYHPQVGERLGD